MRLQRNIEKSWKIYYSCKRAMQRKIKMQSIQKYNLVSAEQTENT